MNATELTKTAFHELKLENKRLERKIAETSETERKRIGRDLHDGVCQFITGIGLIAKELELKLAGKSLPEAETAAKITELLNYAAAEARSLAAGLCPINPGEAGFKTAFSKLASDVKRIFNVPCVFKCGDNIYVEHEDVAVHLYRIAQETITNAIKHGKATEVFVSLDTARDKTVLTVKDNGKDFSGKPEKNTGMGLHILKHRAELINASLDIQRTKAGETILTCSIDNHETSRKLI